MTGSEESRKEGKNLTPVMDYVSVTSIVMPARPGSSGAAVGTMAMQFKLFSLLLPLLLLIFLPSSHWTRALTTNWNAKKPNLRQKAVGGCRRCRRWRLERERLICWDNKQSSHFKWAEFTFELYSSNQNNRAWTTENVGLRVNRNCEHAWVCVRAC